MPVSSESPSQRSRTEGMNSRGHLWVAILPIASARRTMAFSSLGTEPWPARPWAVSRSQTMPFSAVCRR